MRARSFLLLCLLALPATMPAARAEGAVHVPPAHVGDWAVYAAEGSDAPAFAVEWLPAAATRDRWGQERQAFVLETALPAGLVEPDAPAGRWAKVREAYDVAEHALLWRSWDKDTVGPGSEEVRVPFGAVQSPGARDATEARNVTSVSFSAGRMLRSCLAHPALGEVRDGMPVSLGGMCPGLPGQVATGTAQRGADVAGNAVVAMTLGPVSAAGPQESYDLALAPGWSLRLAFADGVPLPIAVSAVRSDGGPAWSYRLAGFRAGNGDVVPPPAPPRAAEPRSTARFAPLADDGPADGGSGIPFPLEAAVASVRGDASLVEFQGWMRAHPQAFVVDAWGTVGHQQGVTTTIWTLLFGEARTSSATPIFDLTAEQVLPDELRGVPGGALVTKYQLGERWEPRSFVRPAGQLAMDVASALEAARRQAPESLAGMPATDVEYVAPSLHGPARLRVELRNDAAYSPDVDGGWSTFDAGTGGLLLQTESHRHTSYGELRLAPPALWEGRESFTSVPPPAPMGMEAAGATIVGLAVLLGLLHGGWLTIAYTRLRRSDLLDNEARLALYERVRADPGVHFNWLAAASGLGSGATAYHLKVLEKGGLVTAVRLRGYKRYYLTGSMSRGMMRGHAELLTPTMRSAYDLVRAQPGITVSELARRTNVAVPSAMRTVARLQAAGLVDKVPAGRVVRLTPRMPGAN
ncbi:MAG: MarR family transcriptional regulator [Halobacteriales archaeon]|nr:MarR family transcriptional regulator [Halobacteriales archaeon]